jgi:hypothetical protein
MGTYVDKPDTYKGDHDMTNRRRPGDIVADMSRAYADAPDPKRGKILESHYRSYQAVGERYRERYERLLTLRDSDPATYTAATNNAMRVTAELYYRDKLGAGAYAYEQIAPEERRRLQRLATLRRDDPGTYVASTDAATRRQVEDFERYRAAHEQYDKETKSPWR